ncbi:hypothetical protein [Nocardia sp. NPDC056100]|uniref:hypothetical protein n=1 Tax=Nocardia sp. NPDC056100 TaxID=3345712 RepID=UPI0035E1D5EB
MALTEHEAKVLGALSCLDVASALSVRELGRCTGLTESSIRKALMRLSRSGLALGTVQGPSRWRPTRRGRLAIALPSYREYAGGRR